jgi:hypothetical protein
MVTRCLTIVCLLAGAASAADVYITQNGSGANSGADCSNARSAAWFNTTSNWGSSAGQIGPGTTVHLCGTFTGAAGSTMLTVRGAGSSGNPITILFEPGAVLTAPYWSNMDGAILSNYDYITIDGGTSGVIQATANGTALAYQKDSFGVCIGELGSSSFPAHNEVRNLTIANMYVRTAGASGTAGGGAQGIHVQTGGYALIHDNTVHDARTAIGMVFQNNVTGDQVYNNKLYNRDAGLIYAPIGAGNSDGALIHDNQIGDAANWDEPTDGFHHDGIHIFTGGTTGAVNNVRIYNNYFYGDTGVYSTAHIFMESYWNAALIYNNVHVNANGHAPSDGYVLLKASGVPGNAYVVNNTYAVSRGTAIALEGTTGNTVQNNIVVGNPTAYGILLETSDAINNRVDYNNYFQATWASAAGIYSNFAQWQSATGFDAHSINSDPGLSSSQVPSSSAALTSGVNFSNLFTIDKSGAARPAAGAWSMGAYQGGGAAPAPAPVAPQAPSGLIVTDVK